ncbi:MAG: hypothetical protein ACTS6P_00990 [Candidatus Hodgkinia cicadicola]
MPSRIINSGTWTIALDLCALNPKRSLPLEGHKTKSHHRESVLKRTGR